jgi:DNA-binding NtrC family response regulator
MHLFIETKMTSREKFDKRIFLVLVVSLTPVGFEEDQQTCSLLLSVDCRRPLADAVDEFEKQVILRMLEQHHWHKGQTAAALGIERKALYRKMKKLGLI